MQTRYKNGLVVLINLILPLHVLIYFQAINWRECKSIMGVSLSSNCGAN